MEYTRKMTQRLQDLRTECINGTGSNSHCRDECGSQGASPVFSLDARRHNSAAAFNTVMVSGPVTSNTCHICEKTFASCNVLKQHLLVHSKERPYTCHECGKSFGRKGVLKRHLVTHSKEKPYHCELCGKGFTQKGSVVKHLVVHTGEKPYQCHKCLGSFTEKSNLLKHLRVIHKEKDRYKCSKCDMRFAFKSQLTAHTNDVHVVPDDKSSDEVALLQPPSGCTPPATNSAEHDLEYDNSFKITTIGIPLTGYPSAPPINGDDSAIFDDTPLNGTLYQEKSQSNRGAGDEARRLDGPVNLGLNKEFSIQNLPKRSSIFVPLVLYTVSEPVL